MFHKREILRTFKMHLTFDLTSDFYFFWQNEEEVLFMGGMYEPKGGEGMDGDYMSRFLWTP